MSAVYSLPPGTETRQPAAIYQTGQLATRYAPSEETAKYSIDVPQQDGINEWIADLRRHLSFPEQVGDTPNHLAAAPVLDSAAGLKRVLTRTGWSLRQASQFFGCSHAQIGRVRDGESFPRHDFAQQIADADTLTQVLFPTAASDPATLSRMLLSKPIDGASESAAEAFRDGDVYRAMALARRVLYPRITGMISVPESPFSNRDATNAYLDEQ